MDVLPTVTISPYPPFADKTVKGLCVNLYPPDTLTVPVTANVLPSKVRLDSTVPFGAVELRVIRPLSVVPVKDNKPLVPDVPAAPVFPLDPEVPDVPAAPVFPLDPEVPDVPAAPVFPLDPEVPDVPAAPVFPLDPEVPEDPDVPDVPLSPLNTQDMLYKVFA